MIEKSMRQNWVGTTRLLVALLPVLLGCTKPALPVESTRAMRIRLQVGDVLDHLEHGTGSVNSIGPVILRLETQLNREQNRLGEYFDTCEKIRDGLVELESLKKKQRREKIANLRGLVDQLPELNAGD